MVLISFILLKIILETVIYWEKREHNRMNILVNDIDVEFSGINLLELADKHGFKDKTGVAVAVNESVIPKSEWQNYILNQNDAVLIITPAQGG